MTEVRPEDAHVVADAKSRPDDGLVIQLVGQANARRKGVPVVADVAVQTVGSIPCYSADALNYIVEATVAFGVNRFGEVHLPAQSIIKCQLGSDAPSVLPVVEHAPLPVGGVRHAADETRERGYIAEQERRQVQSADVAVPSTGLTEGQLAGTVFVAGYAQVGGITEVAAKLEAVVAVNLGKVHHPLPLVLSLRQRTVATLYTKTVTEVRNSLITCSATTTQVEVRQP